MGAAPTPKVTEAPSPGPVTDGCYATHWDLASESSICKLFPAANWRCKCTWDNCQADTLSGCCKKNPWVDQDRCEDKPEPPIACASPVDCATIVPECEAGCK